MGSYKLYACNVGGRSVKVKMGIRTEPCSVALFIEIWQVLTKSSDENHLFAGKFALIIMRNNHHSKQITFTACCSVQSLI